MGGIDFIPDGIDPETSKRGEDYYDTIRSVIDRVLSRRNESEAAIADKYIAQTSSNQNAIQKSPSNNNNGTSTKRGPGRPRRNPAPSSPTGSSTPRSSSPKPSPKVVMDLSWKDGGKNFPKRCSRVGAKYQATELPEAGTWNDVDKDKESSET